MLRHNIESQQIHSLRLQTACLQVSFKSTYVSSPCSPTESLENYTSPACPLTLPSNMRSESRGQHEAIMSERGLLQQGVSLFRHRQQ